jgi:hypothetical protein
MLSFTLHCMFESLHAAAAAVAAAAAAAAAEPASGGSSSSTPVVPGEQLSLPLLQRQLEELRELAAKHKMTAMMASSSLSLGLADSGSEDEEEGAGLSDSTAVLLLVAYQREFVPLAVAAADAILASPLPEEAAAAQALEWAHAAATRSCAFLGCSNLGLDGGADAGKGAGSKRCAGCRCCWYCFDKCAQGDWRGGGHRRVCKALAATRQERPPASSNQLD